VFDKELLSMVMASRSLVERLDPDVVLDRIICEAAGVVGAQASSVIMIEESTGRYFFYFRAAMGPSESKLRRIRFDADLGIAGHVLKTGGPCLVPDARQDPRHYKGIDKITRMETRSLLCVPLLCGGKVAGVLEAVNSTRGPAFTERDLQLLVLFANFAGVALRNSRAFRDTRRREQAFRDALEREQHYPGDSPAMRKVWRFAERAAAADCTALLTGESGVGKEVVAACIHRMSARRDKPFVTVNCAALDENLLNSELFGHEKGAFTGATERRIGRFELAHRGTLFLDEIADCAPATQTRLLRVLEDQSFPRLGGSRTIRTDARLIAATNADLTERMSAGAFREDLFHRINVVTIFVPPLRDRTDEIPGFIEHFVGRFAVNLDREPISFDAAALRALTLYPWPGNVRELRNLVERLMILFPGDTVTAADLDSFLLAPQTPLRQDDAAPPQTGSLWDREKRAIEDALRDARGNKSAAARALGISRHILRYRLKKYNINT